MPIPRTRRELVALVVTSFEKVGMELDAGGPSLGKLACVDDWTVKDLLAVRAWWTDRVADWIEAGRGGTVPVTPAPGYRWSDTPRLNADLVRRARRESYRAVRGRLERGVERVLALIDELDERELLRVGVFEWARRWPIARWISINTARQYTTAATFIRRAARKRAG